MRRSFIAGFAACLVLAPCLTLALAAPEEGGAPAPTVALSVVVSGELNGYLTPCGCSEPMLGGMPRRGSYLLSLSSRTALVTLENGDLTEARGRQDELKAETLVEMLNSLHYAALNLGEKDFRLGVAYLRSLQSRFRGAVLCANARDGDGKALFSEQTAFTRTVAGRPVRVLVVGVLSEGFGTEVSTGSPEARLEAPSVTLGRLVPKLPADSDLRILLYHGPAAEAEELARRFPKFQLVVCAHEGDEASELKRAGGTVLVSGGKDGKHLAEARIKAGDGWRVDAVRSATLSPDFPAHAPIREIEDGYVERVAAENLLGQVVRAPTASGAAFTGSAACAGCHAAAHRTWEGSAHAHAMRTLAEVKRDRDPECVRCHVVGLEQQSGFESRAATPKLLDVGCESCHGAGSKHAQDPKVSLGKAGTASCGACHVPQHSVHFDFNAYWTKIRH